MRGRILLILAVWTMRAGIPHPAAAQQTDALARLRAALPAPAMASLQAAMDEAGRANLPTAPLLDKALEGVAKNVPADRIVAVVQQRLQMLTRARALLPEGRARSAEDLTSAADAMQRGVPEEAVRAEGAAGPPDQPVGMALHVLADLLDRGVPVAAALDVLSAWRTAGGRPEDLGDLPAAVEHLVREGVIPEQAAAAVATSMRGGRGPGGGMGPGGMGPPGQMKAKPNRPVPPVPPGMDTQPPGRGKMPPKKGGRGSG